MGRPDASRPFLGTSIQIVEPTLEAFAPDARAFFSPAFTFAFSLFSRHDFETHHCPLKSVNVSRRLTEGKTQREATRCLKRYLARSLYRQLEAMPPT